MPNPFPSRRLCCCAALLALAGALACEATAQEPAPEPAAQAAALVKLTLPIAGNDDAVLQGKLQRAADELLAKPRDEGAPRPLLVLEFAAGPDAGATEFERALRLARFLVGDEMTRVKTLAYLPESVEGHAVLVALACEEIAMAPDAQLGRAGAADDAARPVEAGVLASYRQIAEARRTAPPAIAAAMVDRSAELVRVESDQGVEYVLGDTLETLRAERTLVSEDILSPTGSFAAFTGRESREAGVARYLAADRDALARALGVPAGALAEDLALAGDWRPVMIDLDGPVTTKTVRRVETLLGDQLERHRVNWIGLRIESSGGDPGAAYRLALTLAELGDGEARTVAYVPRRAEGPAALVALACDQLVLQEEAIFRGVAAEPGDQPEQEAQPDPEAQPEGDDQADDPEDDQVGRLLRLQGDADAEADRLDATLASVRDTLAPATGRGWSLLAAALDPEAELASYTHRETGARRVFCPDELAEQDDADLWRRGEVVKPAGQTLDLPVDRAVELRVAWQKVSQFDDLQALYGFAEAPRTAEPNWALELVEALANPGLAALLLVIGIVGVYIELNTPGVGLGGFVASVALLLFFWSKFLDGTADWLEVILFVTGVVFVLIEIFVLPGFGVFGLGGSLMMIASLVLASQTFVLPQTESQLAELRNSLATVAGAGLGFLVLVGVLRHYLPHSPLFRWAALAPAEAADRIEQDRREALADYAHLVGKTGVATTNLLPGGRAEIDGEPVDVITSGEPIDRGDAIEVVQAKANRVIVRKVSG